jgi:polar amino acid transport system permease protein
VTVGSEVRATARIAPKVVPQRHPGRLAATVVVLLLLAFMIHSVVLNQRLQWPTVLRYFLVVPVVQGVGITLEVTAVVAVVATVLGVLVALARLSANRLLRSLSWGYTWLFRSVPLLLQLLFWYNIATVYPRLSIGVPFGWVFVSGDANRIITPLTAALVGFTLHETAFVAEIVRGAVLAVPRGEIEAAGALGMTPVQVRLRVVLPQAARVALPGMANMVISLVKATAQVSVITLADLLYSVQLIYNRNYAIVPLLIVAALWYMVITSLLSIGQHYVEKRLARGFTRRKQRIPSAAGISAAVAGEEST